MKIRIGDIFRVEHPGELQPLTPPISYASYHVLTRGKYSLGADINKGIWAYKEVKEPKTDLKRRPALLLHSNGYKADSLNVPWIDIIEPENGFAIYNGDNRTEQPPLAARGNSLLERMSRFYSTPELRLYAPPILLFSQHLVNGNIRGYRQFCGYGIPIQYLLQTQSAKNVTTRFTNLVIELALFNLDNESEFFDWEWIDARRDGNLKAEKVLRYAPDAWKMWVSQGPEAIERCRRRVVRNRVVRTREQQPDRKDMELLEAVMRFFADNKYAFEGLAALIAQKVVGQNCVRGWVTKRSGDRGIDFVNRLDVGTDFSRTSMVVLGQAKCISPISSINSKDLARVVARLQRGWLGVYVTTGVYSEPAQSELFDDRYPIVLVNGKRLARELRLILNAEKIELIDLLKREQAWYESHVELIEPERIVDQTTFGTPISDLGTLKAGGHGTEQN